MANLIRDISYGNISSGLISGMLAMTGPSVIILEAASRGHFSLQQTIEWMFAVNFFGGLFSIILPMIYRIPITGAHSLSGVAFLATIIDHFTYSDLIGGYIMSGIIILVVGMSGIFSKIMEWVPKEIIASMMAGIVTGYVVRLISAIHELPIVGGMSVITYFVLMRWGRRIPAAIGAIIIGFVILAITQGFHVASMPTSFVIPAIHMPDFSVMSFLTLSIPLALLVLSNDAVAGIGAMEQMKFQPPIKKIITLSGAMSIVTGFFGGQSANVAGMMSAICADESAGLKEKRYMASIISGVLVLLFGLFSWLIVPFVKALPTAFVSLLAGFALIGVLSSSLHMGFSNTKYRMASLTTFIVALSNVSFLHISSPVWSIVFGFIVYKFFENH